MKPLGSRGMFVRGDAPGAGAASAGPEPAARRTRAGSAPAWKRTLAVLAAAGAAAALWAGTAQPAAAATLTAGPGGLQFAGLVSAPGPSAATDATSLQSGLFLSSELFIPTDPCLPPSLI